MHENNWRYEQLAVRKRPMFHLMIPSDNNLLFRVTNVGGGDAQWDLFLHSVSTLLWKSSVYVSTELSPQVLQYGSI